ncbi:MAG: phage tail tape measure protein, partial [Peptostreptococcaceae bacterium]|nr:phage tail tape measure protein [Peptostreptococcaceae bacterium]
LSGATGDDLKMLEEEAKRMGATTKYSATESADALSYMALAGWDAEQMAAGLEPSLKLAGASGMQLAECTDIVTDTMSMFGMKASEATKMTDMLAYAQANSNTDVQQLGEALKYCGASANAMGYDLADTTALLGTFADQGLKGSSAGTTLNAMFRDMKKNAEDGKIAIGDKNVAIVDANGNYRDMTDILADVQKATEGMTQAERDMALSSIWGTEALKGVNMAFEAGVPKIREFEDGIRKSDGAASDMYDTMQNNLKGAIDNMKSAFEGVMITIGERLIPIFQNVVDGITNMLTWFNNLNPTIQNVIIGVGGFLAILGPLLLIIGNIIIFITNLGAAIGTLITFFSAGGVGAGILSAAIGAITGPVGLVIAIITALIAVGVLLYKNWDIIKSKCQEIWEGSIKPTIEKVTNTIKSVISTVWDGIKSFLTTCWNGIKSVGTSVWEGIKTLISTVVNAIKSVIESVFNSIKTIVSNVFNGIKNTVSTVWNSIQSVVTTYVNAVRSVIQSVFSAIQGIINATSNGWKATIQAAWNGIKSVVSTGVNAVRSVISSVWSGLQAILVAPFQAAQSVISGILSGISNAISSVKNAISSVKSAASSVVDKINPFKKSIDIAYSTEEPSINARFRSDAINLARDLVYSDKSAKASIAESISNVSKSASGMIKNKDISNIKPGNSVVINNTYNSPKPASIRELKRQDEIQMRRLAMQLGF